MPPFRFKRAVVFVHIVSRSEGGLRAAFRTRCGQSWEEQSPPAPVSLDFFKPEPPPAPVRCP